MAGAYERDTSSSPYPTHQSTSRRHLNGSSHHAPNSNEQIDASDGDNAMTLFIKKIILLSLFGLSTASALAQDWKNPEAKFDASKLMTSKTTISWFRVDNVQATCEKESRKRGLGGFGYAISACSFWNGNDCQIYTGKKTTMHELGHETRHCFQGNFH